MQEARVVASRAPTPGTHAIRLERPDGFVFRAGQHVMLEVGTMAGPDDRVLSIASSPSRPHLEFAVRRSGSTFKEAFAALRPGDAVRMSQASGRFLLDATKPALLLSGGIGITPLKSMIEHVVDE